MSSIPPTSAYNWQPNLRNNHLHHPTLNHLLLEHMRRTAMQIIFSIITKWSFLSNQNACIYQVGFLRGARLLATGARSTELEKHSSCWPCNHTTNFSFLARTISKILRSHDTPAKANQHWETKHYFEATTSSTWNTSAHIIRCKVLLHHVCKA